MNKKDVINVAKQHITTRFMNMTRDEFADLSAGDGTLSVVDETLDMLPIAYEVSNPEVKQIVEEFDETDIEELVQHCTALSDVLYNHFSVTPMNAKYSLIKIKRVVNTDLGYVLTDETDYYDYPINDAIEEFQSNHDNCNFQLTAIKED